MLTYNIIKYSYLMFTHMMFAQHSFQIHILETWKPFKFTGSWRRRFPRCQRKCPQRDFGKLFSSVHYTRYICFFQTSIGNSWSPGSQSSFPDPGGEDPQDVTESVLKEIVVSYSLVCIILHRYILFLPDINWEFIWYSWWSRSLHGSPWWVFQWSFQ